MSDSRTDLHDVVIGTPLHQSATRVMLLGAGELGKEVAIEAQRLGLQRLPTLEIADTRNSFRQRLSAPFTVPAIREIVLAQRQVPAAGRAAKSAVWA